MKLPDHTNLNYTGEVRGVLQPSFDNWISVKGNKPDLNNDRGCFSDKVLATDGDIVFISCFHCDGSWEVPSYCVEVTHWMPLPELPNNNWFCISKRKGMGKCDNQCVFCKRI